jgi:general secretion pathway protein E/type IV pilus assembly protein PilB
MNGENAVIADDLLDEVGLCAKAAGLDEERVRELSAFAAPRGQSLIDALILRGGAQEQHFIAELSRLLHLPLQAEEIAHIPDEVLLRIPASLAIRHQVVPFEDRDGRLRVAVGDPFDWASWDDLQQVVEGTLEKVLCPPTIIEKMIRTHFGLGADTVERLVSGREDRELVSIGPQTTDLSDEKAANEPTVVNLVNQILSEAIREGVTDIHFEPFESRYRIRYRIDGMLEEVPIPASVNALQKSVVSRIKIMSGLDITNKRLPQDGRAQVSLGGQRCDLRVSVLPGIHGEAIVIRVQNRQAVRLDLESLGFETHQQQRIDRLARQPYGLVLVTGPTGSGKTTTLYTCLQNLRSSQTKIITIEDPVEYWMDDILQMQVKDEIGFTFSRALRSMLRHDPDIMLVGEIRDRETAEIAIRSALTGHLVFATLHTNDASGAVGRLCDIGIDPVLVAGAVQGVLAQRLVRRICPHCKSAVSLESLEPFEQDILLYDGVGRDETLWKGMGCEACRFAGYRGRKALGEVLIVSCEIRRRIQQRAGSDEIRQAAIAEGMLPLRKTALGAVRRGDTTLSEVLRVTQEDA